MDVAFLVVLGSAFVLGITHAFEVDHMTAVTTFVAQKPTPKQAALFGIKWAAGHGLSLLVLGTIIYALRLSVSDSVASTLERLVGVALFALGVWTLVQLRRSFLGHTHSHSHENGEHAGEANGATHTHADGTTHSHGHRHDSLLMGVLHGAAGTAAFVGKAAVAASKPYAQVVSFTLAFSVGVLVAMAAYGVALGSVLSVGERYSRALVTGVRVLTGLFACAVGLYWVFR